jgi:hypothetical protein
MKSTKNESDYEKEVEYPYLMIGTQSESIYLMTSQGTGIMVYNDLEGTDKLGKMSCTLSKGAVFTGSICLEN